MAIKERRLTPRVLGPEMLIFPAVLAAPFIVLATGVMKGKISPLLVVAAVLVVEVTAITLFLRSYLRVRRLLRRHGRFMCLNCLYPLGGLSDSGVCPECADPYSRDELERLWRSWEHAVNKGKDIAGKGESREARGESETPIRPSP